MIQVDFEPYERRYPREDRWDFSTRAMAIYLSVRHRWYWIRHSCCA